MIFGNFWVEDLEQVGFKMTLHTELQALRWKWKACCTIWHVRKLDRLQRLDSDARKTLSIAEFSEKAGGDTKAEEKISLFQDMLYSSGL